MKTTLPFRQIHLDFHTAPQIPDVGAEFDPDVFGNTMARAHVNSVTVFAKCHHGHLYYRTNRPERHPGLRADLDLLERQVEALPTGGWGYVYFPRNVRFARTFGKPALGMTARFHLSWADFGGLKFPAALEYETSQMVAQSAACSIGDQLHPRGTLDLGAYELIGGAYQRIAEREPWLEGAKAVAEIGVLGAPTGVQGTTQTQSGTDDGVTRLLMQLKQQFDFLHPESDLSHYRLLILPDCIPVDEPLRARLSVFLRNGGALLATGTSGLNTAGTGLTIPELPVTPQGLSPFTTTYMRFQPPFDDKLPTSDHVVYPRGTRVLPVAGAETVARVVEPYFERAWDHFSSHRQTPADQLTDYAAAVVKGRVGYVNFPLFSMYAGYGNYTCRTLLEILLARLLPEPLLRVDGPVGVEASLTRQPGREIVHLLFYPALYGAIIEDLVPLCNLPVSLRMASRPRQVLVVPEKTALTFDYADGYCRFTLPELRGLAMIAVKE